MYNEALVALLFAAKGFQLIAHRLQTPWAEIDLIFSDESNGLTIVEVKTVRLDQYIPPISHSQKKRLARAHLHVQSFYGRPVQSHLALVNDDQYIEVIEDFLC